MKKHKKGKELEKIKEDKEMQEYLRYLEKNFDKLSYKFEENKDGKIAIDMEVKKEKAAMELLYKSFGTDNEHVFNHLFNCISFMFGSNYAVDNINFLTNFLKEQKPKDSIEAMLLVQMVATHNTILNSISNANLKDQTSYGKQANYDRTTKFSRTYIAQMEALKRYKSKGEHKIIVEKVNVENGGKAVIGDVNTQINNKKPEVIDDIV